MQTIAELDFLLRRVVPAGSHATRHITASHEGSDLLDHRPEDRQRGDDLRWQS